MTGTDHIGPEGPLFAAAQPLPPPELRPDNPRRLLEACARAGLPRSYYGLTPNRKRLNVLDGLTVREFPCAPDTLPGAIDQALHRIWVIGDDYCRAHRRQADAALPDLNLTAGSGEG